MYTLYQEKAKWALGTIEEQLWSNSIYGVLTGNGSTIKRHTNQLKLAESITTKYIYEDTQNDTNTVPQEKLLNEMNSNEPDEDTSLYKTMKTAFLDFRVLYFISLCVYAF